MSWPLGYGRSDITYRTRPNGVVLANGIEVTEPGGWLDVPSLPSALARGAPVVLRLQIRTRLDARGRTYLFAGAVRADGKDYPDPHMVTAAWADAWLDTLADAAHAAIGRNLHALSRARTAPALRVAARPANGEHGHYAMHTTPARGVDVLPLPRDRRDA